MILEVSKTKLENVLAIKLSVFEDFRGNYVELYNWQEYQKRGIQIEFVSDTIAISSQYVLRGIHGDDQNWKLISCLHGKFYLVVVNCDTSSPKFGKWEAFTLSDRSGLQVLVPPGYGNAHLVLSDLAVFHYKQSAYYDLSRQFTYRFDDPRFKIFWPVLSPILSERDIC